MPFALIMIRQSPSSNSLHLALHLYLLDVANLYVVELVDVQAALKACVHLLHIVFEALERAQVAGVDHDAIADEAHLAGTYDFALAHV